MTGIGLAAAVVLIGASATMNYLFAISLGKTWLEGQVLGGVSVAADVLKAIVVVLIAAAAHDGRRTFVVIGSLAFVLFSTASLVAATGFASQNRGAVIDGRSAARAELARAERDLAETERKLARLPSFRTKSVAEAALAGYEVDPRWHAAGACRQTVTPALRDFCRAVSDLRQELAVAAEAARLESDTARQRARIEYLAASGANHAADPQAHLLAAAFGLNEGTVQRLLMALLALVVEVASGLGIYLATGHGHTGGKASGAASATPPPNAELGKEPPVPIPVVPDLVPTRTTIIPAADIAEQPSEPTRGRRLRSRASIEITAMKP